MGVPSLEFALVTMNRTLSIAIPTFNRPELLKRSIVAMLPELRPLGVPIYVSDDSPTAETETIIRELQVEYEHLFYRRNTPGLKDAGNILATLQLPATDYVWLLGDSLIILPGGVTEALDLLTRFRPDILAVNAVGRDLDVPSAFYSDPNEVLNCFGWHLTLTGATIYSRPAVQSIQKIDVSRYKNFPQFALIFNHIAGACSFYWNNTRCLLLAGARQSSWAVNMLPTFIDDWAGAVGNLPTIYDEPLKSKVIIEHSRRTGIFGAKSLLAAREFDGYNLRLFWKYRARLRKHSGLNSIVLWLIACASKKTPVRLARWIKPAGRRR